DEGRGDQGDEVWPHTHLQKRIEALSAPVRASEGTAWLRRTGAVPRGFTRQRPSKRPERRGAACLNESARPLETPVDFVGRVEQRTSDAHVAIADRDLDVGGLERGARIVHRLAEIERHDR